MSKEQLPTGTTEDNQPANSRQVAGDHYRSSIQHWDFVAANNLDYFQGQVTKYVARWKSKGGLQDLEKAHHFLQKYIELVKEGKYKPNERAGLPAVSSPDGSRAS